MGDRAIGKNHEGLPREVFELDKDERWQARLDEARARREIALRDKAVGKSTTPRPKPWEIEGADTPKPLEPIIQERGDDKFDFADRLEQIREGDKAAAKRPSAERSRPATKKTDVTTAKKRPRPAAAKPKPDPKAAETPIEPRKPAAAPEHAETSPVPRRERQKPSLVLPDAPDVAEIAARYADTLNPEPAAPVIVPERPAAEPEPVPLRKPSPHSLPDEPKKRRWSVRLPRLSSRPGIRPLGMAWGLLAVAALPLTTEAPPLEKGPRMPVIASFPAPPALGVTWSLYARPFETSSHDWKGGSAPAAMVAPSFDPPTAIVTGIRPPQVPVPLEASGAPRPAEEPQTDASATPALDAPASVPSPPAAIPAPPPPEKAAALPDVRPAPSRPTEAAPVPVAVEQPTTAAENSLRITILTPPRADRAVAETLAADVPARGHELVRVREVDFPISSRNLRYFHEADRAEAARLARAYDAELRDFTWFRPQPLPGTAELWLSGAGVEQISAPAAATAPVEELPFAVIRPAEVPDQTRGLLDRVMQGVGNALGNSLGISRDTN